MPTSDQNRLSRFIAPGLAAVAFAAALPAGASAATTIGPNLAQDPQISNGCGNKPNNGGPAPGCDIVQVTLGGINQAPASDGVIVRWRVRGASGPLKLRVFKQLPGGNAYFASSSGPVETVGSPDLQTFPVRLPIAAGEYPGVEVASPDATLGLDEDNTVPDGNVAAGFYEPFADATVMAPAVVATHAISYVNVDVEPDADHDGYGDETQDLCPTDPTTQGACPVPTQPAQMPKPRIAPRVTAAGRSVHLFRRDRIAIRLTADRSLKVTARASIRLAKLLKLAPRTVELRSGRTTTVLLAVPHRSLGAVRRALGAKHRLPVRVTVSAQDATGARSTRVLKLVLRG